MFYDTFALQLAAGMAPSWLRRGSDLVQGLRKIRLKVGNMLNADR